MPVASWVPILSTLLTIRSLIWGVPTTVLRFDNLLEWLTELRKHHPCDYSFILKIKIDQDPSNKVTHRAKSGMAPNIEFLCLFSVKLGCITFLTHHCVHQSESATELWCPEFLPDVVGMIDQIFEHVIKLNLSLSPAAQRLGWLRGSTKTIWRAANSRQTEGEWVLVYAWKKETVLVGFLFL